MSAFKVIVSCNDLIAIVVPAVRSEIRDSLKASARFLSQGSVKSPFLSHTTSHPPHAPAGWLKHPKCNNAADARPFSLVLPTRFSSQTPFLSKPAQSLVSHNPAASTTLEQSTSPERLLMR